MQWHWEAGALMVATILLILAGSFVRDKVRGRKIREENDKV